MSEDVSSDRSNALSILAWLIALIGVIVPRRLQADWRQEWGEELQYREAMLLIWTSSVGKQDSVISAQSRSIS